MSDLISRQTAIDIIEGFPHGDVWNVESMEEMVDRIKQLPSAQPKMGRWIEIINSRGVVVALRCSRCEKSPRHGVRSDFCPNCGADMRGEQDG